MSRRARPLVVCVLAVLSSAGRATAEPLPADPAVVRGTLENGLTYLVRRHAHPPGRATVWLHIHSGSLNETDRQRGIAHYLEHMAFNGSEHFPPGTVVPFFQSLGMTFGRDQNAFTNVEQTTYQLSLPDARPETVGKAMTYFADVLHRLLLSPKEIDAERQIIQEERRRGLSGRQRVRDLVRDRIAPGSRWSQRETIGTEATIDGFTTEDFRDYYGTWYTASNATLLVVADAEEAAIVRQVEAAFASAPKRPRPTPATSGVTAYERSFAIVASDPELSSEEVRITRLGPVGPPRTTRAQWRDDLVLRLALAALNRRLEDKIARGGPSYLRADVSAGDQGRQFREWEVSGQAAPGRWRTALEELALELQRARTFGFTARELDDAKKQALAAAERDVETAETTPASDLVRRMNAAVTTGDVLLAPRARLDLLRETLPSLTREEVGRRFAEELDPRAVAFVAVLPAGPGVPTEAQLLDVGTKALAVEPTPDVEVAHATRLMAELPVPGEVAEGAEHAATGVWSGWLKNGVRVHHRLMDARRHEVTVELSLVGGELLETAQNRGITSAALVAWRNPTTKSLSSSDVRELLTGKKVTVRTGAGGRRGGGGRAGGVGEGAITLGVAGSPDDLETGLQLAHLLLTQPRVEPTAFGKHLTSTLEALAESSKNPMALGLRTVASAAYPDDDVRLQPTTAEQLARLTVEGAQAWLEQLVRTSPIEVTVVGDLPRERALALVARYVGSLPARARVGPDTYRAQRTVKRPAGPRRLARTIDTPTAQAFVVSGFYGADETNRPDVRALDVAA